MLGAKGCTTQERLVRLSFFPFSEQLCPEPPLPPTGGVYDHTVGNDVAYNTDVRYECSIGRSLIAPDGVYYSEQLLHCNWNRSYTPEEVRDLTLYFHETWNA